MVSSFLESLTTIKMESSPAIVPITGLKISEILGSISFMVSSWKATAWPCPGMVLRKIKLGGATSTLRRPLSLFVGRVLGRA